MVTRKIITSLAISVFIGVVGTAFSAEKDMAPIELKLPNAAFSGTPPNFVLNEHIEPPVTNRPPFLAPKGVLNLALNKKVTSSDASPISGELELVTDGNKESADDTFVELHRKVQWVQIDLENPAEIFAIVVWHAHNIAQVYKCVIVQVSDDKEFKNEVKTVFNNDYENEAGLGLGTDKQYFESYLGKLIDTKGVKGRYVRLYSKGSTYSALNRYTEVEVYGLASK